MRTKVITPMIDRRQERLCNELQDSIRDKSGESLSVLKGLLGSSIAMDVAVEPVAAAAVVAQVAAKEKRVRKSHVPVKAARNARKTMVWFK